MKFITFFALFASVAFAAPSNNELARRIDLLSEEITNLKAHQMGVAKNESVYGLGNSASKVYFVPQGLSIGAYGEIIYTSYASENQDGDSVSKDPTLEALRYVLYVGYKFNDKWVFNSEIEIEHVNEIYNEFMYVDYLHDETLNARAGLILLPVGFVNMQHEPTMFPSVQRPLTEKYIIPSTWREIGAGVFGQLGNFDYNLYVMNGGDADDISASSGFRGARKKGGNGSNDDKKNAATGVVTGRLDYNFNPNTNFGVSFYTGQASSPSTTEDLETTLYDVHAQWAQGAWRIRALFTEMSYGNADDWNAVTTGDKLQKKIHGGYLEAMYNVFAGKSTAALSPFVRYERINLNADFDEDDYTYNAARDFNSYTVGVAYAPIPRLVFKADYAFIDQKDDAGINEFNLGMGFNF